MTLRDTIKELCKRNNISINQLESDLGFARGYVSKLDKSTPNSAKLQSIADYFNVTLDLLMNGVVSEDEKVYYLNPETAAIAQEIYENPDLRILMDASRKASPEDLKFIIEMTKRFKGQG